jgi:hypothetical protein
MPNAFAPIRAGQAFGFTPRRPFRIESNITSTPISVVHDWQIQIRIHSSQDLLDHRAVMMTCFDQNSPSVGPPPGGLLRVVTMRQPQRWIVRKEGSLLQPAIAAARDLEGGYTLTPLCRHRVGATDTGALKLLSGVAAA